MCFTLRREGLMCVEYLTYMYFGILVICMSLKWSSCLYSDVNQLKKNVSVHVAILQFNTKILN